MEPANMVTHALSPTATKNLEPKTKTLALITQIITIVLNSINSQT